MPQPIIGGLIGAFIGFIIGGIRYDPSPEAGLFWGFIIGAFITMLFR